MMKQAIINVTVEQPNPLELLPNHDDKLYILKIISTHERSISAEDLDGNQLTFPTGSRPQTEIPYVVLVDFDWTGLSDEYDASYDNENTIHIGSITYGEIESVDGWSYHVILLYEADFTEEQLRELDGTTVTLTGDFTFDGRQVEVHC